MKTASVIVVSHLHYDPEWFEPFTSFQEARYVLVKQMDRLLRILDDDPRYRSFALDGSTLALETYLNLRPDKEHELRKHVTSGRLSVGPWYTQPDLFLTSPEALVRNLILGIRDASRLGAVTKVCYTPDSFGFPAQFSQILNGFGIHSLFFMRGLGEEGDKFNTEFIWEAPNGSKTTAVHLGYLPAEEGFCNLIKLPQNPKDQAQFIRKLVLELLEHSSTKNVLLLDGGCTLAEIGRCPLDIGKVVPAPRPNLGDLIENFSSHLKEFNFSHGTLSDYIQRINEEAPKLGTYKGELRGARFQKILYGSTSARMPLKLQNWICQRQLENYAEPLATISWILGSSYPSSMLESAWRYLLQNHQHDSICGTSDDKAFRYDMMRYEWIRQITDCVIRESMAAIANKINTTFAVASSYVVVMNTLAWNRDGFAREKISLPRDVSCFKLLDTSGKEITYQVHDKKDGEVDVSFVALDVPAMGYKSYAIVKADKETLFDSDIAVGAHTLENRFLRVELDSKNGGRLTVFDRRRNKSWTGLGVLQDSGDAGDLYGCSPPDHDEVISSLSARAEIAVVERGPVRGVLRTKLTLSIPQQLTKDRNSRSETRVECQVATDVVLYSGIPIIELTIRYNNAAEDHRLRMVFPLGAHADSSFAESQFYIVERPTRLPKASGWQEKHPGTHPQLGWVDAGNGKSGLTIANRGSAEFEVSGEAESAIYLTLLRSVGFLFRPDTQYGPMKGGIPAPEAQCLGDHLFSYALIPHKSTWLESRAYKDAKNFNVPLLALNVDRHDGSLEPVMSFLRLEPDTLILSALKKAEDDGSAIVRFYNICDKETEATLDWFKSPSKIGSATIDEDMLDEAQPEDRKHGIPTRPYEVKTLKVLF